MTIAPITVFLEIKPHPQERIRIAFRKRRATAYYPKKTTDFQEDVRLMIQEYMKENNIPEFPKGIPLALEAIFYLPKPKSTKREYPTIRPDLSNYLKSLEDGLQRSGKDAEPALMEDDSCICSITCVKKYVDDEYPEPGILVTLEEYSG